MNHPRENQQQAKQDVDEKILADTPFQSDGDRRQKNGDQDHQQLVHVFELRVGEHATRLSALPRLDPYAQPGNRTVAASRLDGTGSWPAAGLHAAREAKKQKPGGR
jgi:hypothetical protein